MVSGRTDKFHLIMNQTEFSLVHVKPNMTLVTLKKIQIWFNSTRFRIYRQSRRDAIVSVAAIFEKCPYRTMICMEVRVLLGNYIIQ